MTGERRVVVPDDLLARFDVVESDVRVDSHEFVMAHPRSAEALLDEAEFTRDQRMPYWADIWPSSTALAREVLRQSGRGRRAIEIGCGVGVGAVAAACAGYEVTVSDYYEDAMRFAAANVKANTGVEASERLFDWRDVPESLGRFDLVLAADVLYETRYAGLVAGAVDAVLAPGGTALIADPGRIASSEFVLEMMARGFRCATRVREQVGADAREHWVSVLEVERLAPLST